MQAFVLSLCIAAATWGLPIRDAAAGAAIFPANGSNSATASSWLAGAHAGYNWQHGPIVYGFESDLSATNLNSAMSGGLSYPVPGVPPPGDAAGTNASIDWYGTFRARLGATTGPVLFYGTAGFAYGNVNLNSSFTTSGVSTGSQTSTLRGGWVAGGGIEYMWNRNLILSLAYQYVDLGTAYTASSDPAFIMVGQSASAHAQFQAVMAGLSWRFPPTGSAAPWEGGYVGGQVGGAWGNQTTANYTSSIPAAVSDVRLKRDIALVGRRADGLGIYRFKYLWSDTVYVGVVAQEVALIRPDAIVREPLDSFLRVDYTRLGLKLMTLAAWEAWSIPAWRLTVAVA